MKKVIGHPLYKAGSTWPYIAILVMAAVALVVGVVGIYYVFC
jgi:hypothetical protein